MTAHKGTKEIDLIALAKEKSGSILSWFEKLDQKGQADLQEIKKEYFAHPGAMSLGGMYLAVVEKYGDIIGRTQFVIWMKKD